ncbi:hypothetical protein GGS23DRAFT_614056 [Durotheca rogersii]|uniref:uncharacterized protein n=1 Tax=Durotheca rogersii TaxID=419775 RepID=UPI00221ECCA3|nr:uncharacterized protein GGS23DRAFT_614056 [Durotheca rogersii]KAI5860209.1 hypothetical protein GGS23DRAFT_614056 [Durotheca rogersii]
MANLPSQHPHLSLHLTDRALTPLVTSARSAPQLDALGSLSHAALAAHEAAQRLGLGQPRRVLVEHGRAGPLLLQSFVRPTDSDNGGGGADSPARRPRDCSRPSSSSPRPATPGANGTSAAAAAAATPTRQPHQPRPPAPADPAGEAAAAQLHRLQLRAGVVAPSDVDARPRPSRSPSAVGSDDHRHTTSDVRNGSPDAGADAADSDSDPSDGDEDADAPPMFIGVVVGPGGDESHAREARRAAARLERVAREVQAHWAEAQAQLEPEGDGGGGEGPEPRLRGGAGGSRGRGRGGEGAGD